MSALEQSLDAIIASDKATKANQAAKTSSQRKGKKATKSGKSKVSGRNNRSRDKAKKAATAAIAAAAIKRARKRKMRTSGVVVRSGVDASSLQMANKVVMSGLPSDIKPHNVREFFEAEIGGVKSIDFSYSSKGKFTGTCTVVFKHATVARKAVAKYNNAPIDGNRKKLKLELIIDPAQRPLSARITPNIVVNPNDLKSRLRNKRSGRAPRKQKKQQQQKQQQQKKKAAKKPKKKQHRKTVAELDQEMEDYFSKGQQQEQQQ